MEIDKQAQTISNDSIRRDDMKILETARENVESTRQAYAKLIFEGKSGVKISGLPVEIEQISQDFLFGNLIFDLVWGDPVFHPELFKRRFLELFNFAIFPFYWSSYEKKPGFPEWSRLLPTLEWCLANGITPKGHPLVWPYSAGIPEWLYDAPEESIEALIQARVTSIVQGFKPGIQIWDVTNEAINHVSWREATQCDFRHRYHEITDWRGTPVSGAFKHEIPISEAADWVEKSLQWAYAANPQASLIVNDYNQEFEPQVRQRFYDLIKELQNRSAPISGIGLQVHPVNYWIWPHELWNTLEMYRELNLPIHITELHQPSSRETIEGGWKQGYWDEIAQAEFIEQLYRLSFGHPSVVSINYWGLSDHNIWIQKAGLIDAEYRPKPAFDVLKKLIKGEWMTPKQQLTTNENGELSFKGFYGRYEIRIHEAGKKTLTQQVHMSNVMVNDWRMII
jgi:endo-1,4-beta-xylanase